MTTIIFSYASERFGWVEKGKTKPTSYTMNRLATKIHHLCQELCTLKKQYKKAAEEEKQPLAELQKILQKKLMILRRAEWHRTRGRKRARKRAAFITNPFGLTKQLLGDKRAGWLECSTEEVNRFLQDTMSHSLREQELETNKALVSPPPRGSQASRLRKSSWQLAQHLCQAPVVYLIWSTSAAQSFSSTCGRS